MTPPDTAVVPPPRAMTLWKKIALISFFGGAGFALFAAGILGGVAWYSSRPTPPKPWDVKTLVATFDEVNVEGDNHHYVFYYTVQNNGDADYSQETDQTGLLYQVEC